jgi:hypothetical protein
VRGLKGFAPGGGKVILPQGVEETDGEAAPLAAEAAYGLHGAILVGCPGRGADEVMTAGGLLLHRLLLVLPGASGDGKRALDGLMAFLLWGAAEDAGAAVAAEDAHGVGLAVDVFQVKRGGAAAVRAAPVGGEGTDPHGFSPPFGLTLCGDVGQQWWLARATAG